MQISFPGNTMWFFRGFHLLFYKWVLTGCEVVCLQEEKTETVIFIMDFTVDLVVEIPFMYEYLLLLHLASTSEAYRTLPCLSWKRWLVHSQAYPFTRVFACNRSSFRSELEACTSQVQNRAVVVAWCLAGKSRQLGWGLAKKENHSPPSLSSHFQICNKEGKGQSSIKTTVREPKVRSFFASYCCLFCSILSWFHIDNTIFCLSFL